MKILSKGNGHSFTIENSPKPNLKNFSKIEQKNSKKIFHKKKITSKRGISMNDLSNVSSKGISITKRKTSKATSFISKTQTKERTSSKNHSISSQSKKVSLHKKKNSLLNRIKSNADKHSKSNLSLLNNGNKSSSSINQGVAIKKRRISIINKKDKIKKNQTKDLSLKKKEKKEDNIQNSFNMPENQSKISSSFGISLDSKHNLAKELDKPITPDKVLEDSEVKAKFELTDKPLKSVFLFENMKEMPINCTEKDSITYKIGNQAN